MIGTYPMNDRIEIRQLQGPSDWRGSTFRVFRDGEGLHVRDVGILLDIQLIVAPCAFLMLYLPSTLISFCHCSTVPSAAAGQGSTWIRMERVAYVVRPRNRWTWVSRPIKLRDSKRKKNWWNRQTNWECIMQRQTRRQRLGAVSREARRRGGTSRRRYRSSFSR